MAIIRLPGDVDLKVAEYAMRSVMDRKEKVDVRVPVFVTIPTGIYHTNRMDCGRRDGQTQQIYISIVCYAPEVNRHCLAILSGNSMAGRY